DAVSFPTLKGWARDNTTLTRDVLELDGYSVRNNHITRLRDPILVECLDREVVALSYGQGPKLEGLASIGEHLIGLIEFVRRYSPQDVVSHRVRHALPGDERVAGIRVAPHGQPAGRRRRAAGAIPEHPEVADGEVRSRDVHVLVPDVARLDRGGQLDVGVRPVARLVTQVGQEPPPLAVDRSADAEPRVDRRIVHEDVRPI